MLKFDHIALGARDLEKSSKTLSEQLGVLPFGGGEHELFGTHNKLWRIETKAYPIYFELLAINSGLDATLRAEVMAQAGQAWLQAGEPEKADGALSDAIVVRPRDPSIWIDRSVVRASVGDYDRAILDLAQALRIDPDRVEALTLRSAAYRLTGRTDAALDDINAALARDPGNPEALLERGRPDQLHVAVIIASEEGVEFVRARLPADATFWIGAVDPSLTPRMYIVPGLGDAGDLASGAKD